MVFVACLGGDAGELRCYLPGFLSRGWQWPQIKVTLGGGQDRRDLLPDADGGDQSGDCGFSIVTVSLVGAIEEDLVLMIGPPKEPPN